MELGRVIDRALQPVQRKLRMMVTRGVVKLVDASTLLQELQVAAVGEELLDNIEHWEPYGYTSRPQPGAEALLLSLGGDRGHTVAVSVADRRFRLKGLAAGEVALFTDEGDVIHFKRGNHIYIDAMNQVTVKAGTKVVIDAPLAEFTGDVTIVGEATISSIPFTTHVHPENDAGGPTGVPQ